VARDQDPVGGASHSASSDLSDVGADRPFAGMAFDKMRRPRDPTYAQHAGVENVSRSFHAHREPQQSTRFGRLAIIPILSLRTESY
jgi:hypothetical protein